MATTKAKTKTKANQLTASEVLMATIHEKNPGVYTDSALKKAMGSKTWKAVLQAMETYKNG